MSEAARHLQVVGEDGQQRLITEEGELVDECPNCAALTDQLVGAENNVRSMRAQMANLKREIAGELDEEHQHFPEAVSLFRYWAERCNHPRMEFTPDRMALVLPFIKRHGAGPCRQAIRGAEYDPFVTTRKNGSQHRHNGWNQIFANEDKFQDYRARAPNPPKPTISQQTLIDHASEVASRCLERARLVEKADDPVAASHFLIEVNRLVTEWLALPTKEDQ